MVIRVFACQIHFTKLEGEKLKALNDISTETKITFKCWTSIKQKIMPLKLICDLLPCIVKK